MKTQSPDTHPQAERVLIEGYRRMSPEHKLGIMQEMARHAEAVQRAEIALRHPRADEREIRQRFAARWLGSELAARVLAARERNETE